MTLKRDQIWQREAALHHIGAARADLRPFAELQRWARGPAISRTKFDLKQSFEAMCHVAAWYIDGPEVPSVSWQVWLEIQSTYVETLLRFKVQPRESRLSFLYGLMAFGLMRRGETSGSDFTYVKVLQSLLEATGAHRLIHLNLSTAGLQTPKPTRSSLQSTSNVWRQQRLLGYCFEVIADAETQQGRRTLSPEELWEVAAAKAQMTGDVSGLLSLVPHIKHGPTAQLHLQHLFLWCTALPSSDGRRRFEELMKRGPKFKLASDSPSDQLIAVVHNVYKKPQRHAWLKTYDWICASMQLSPDAAEELVTLNFAALTRWCHRIHYGTEKKILLERYREQCLASSEHTIDDLFAVADDLIGIPKPLPKEQEEGLSLAARWLRRSATGSLTWRVLATMGRKRVRQLVRGKVVAERLSKAEGVAVTRLIVDELGRLKGPIMKIGQTASYFGLDMPPEAIEALALLRDKATAMPFAEVRVVLQKECSSDLDEIFASIDPTPIGVGSIGQVHHAVLKTGEQVAIKIQFPNIRAIITEDLNILRVLVILGQWLLPTANIRSHLDELESQLLHECDFLREAAMQTRFRDKFVDRKDIVIPKVYENLSTKKVLITSYESGLDLKQFHEQASEEERDRMGDALIHFVVSSCRDGLFQSDNHPGNYRFRHNGALVCFDFGSVKEWTPQATMLWSEMIRAGHERNFARFRRAAIAMGRQRNIKEALHRRMYDIYVSHSMHFIGEPTNTKFKHDILHREIKQFFSPMTSEIWDTSPDPQFIFGFRVYFGLIALMSEIGARGNWHAAIKNIMYR